MVKVVISMAMADKPHYRSGDYVKFEIRDDQTGVSEWMWLRVEKSDDSERVVLGKLDNQPVAFAQALRLGQDLIVSYDNIRDHRESNDPFQSS